MLAAGRLPSWLLSVAITNDAALVVGSTYDRTLVWDAQDGMPRAELPGATQVILVPNADGREREVVLASDDLVIVPLEGGEPRTFTGGRAPVALSRDGRWLAARGVRGAHLFDLESGERRHLQAGHEDAVTGLAFGPKHLYIAYDYRAGGAERTTVDRFRLEDARRDTLETGVLFFEPFVAVSPDGQRIAVKARYDCNVRLLDAEGRAVAQITTSDSAHPSAVAFSPDGARLAMMKSTSISLWRTDDGSCLGIIDDLPSHPRTAVAFCNDDVIVCDDIDGYRFADIVRRRFCNAAAGLHAFQRDARALIEGVSLSAPHESDYRTSATPSSERQDDGAWQVEINEAGITLFVRARDGEHGAIKLELGAFLRRPTSWADVWADEHHVFAADVQWARALTGITDQVALQVKRTPTNLGVELNLACAPPPTTVRAWLSALATRLRTSRL